MEDTVEKKVEGLAEQIIAEDAEKRQQDLVSYPFSFGRSLTDRWVGRIYSTLRQNELTGI